ncbi:hypothetical protein M8818_006853 [Zalaria obscura]|uniref:Uncharacterized protein n=1 Tax=Zalaria obscura TaxID=2024903 RepID=A0ACC3S5J5_9PEZI
MAAEAGSIEATLEYVRRFQQAYIPVAPPLMNEKPVTRAGEEDPSEPALKRKFKVLSSLVVRPLQRASQVLSQVVFQPVGQVAKYSWRKARTLGVLLTPARKMARAVSKMAGKLFKPLRTNRKPSDSSLAKLNKQESVPKKEDRALLSAGRERKLCDDIGDCVLVNLVRSNKGVPAPLDLYRAWALQTSEVRREDYYGLFCDLYGCKPDQEYGKILVHVKDLSTLLRRRAIAYIALGARHDSMDANADKHTSGPVNANDRREQLRAFVDSVDGVAKEVIAAAQLGPGNADAEKSRIADNISELNASFCESFGLAKTDDWDVTNVERMSSKGSAHPELDAVTGPFLQRLQQFSRVIVYLQEMREETLLLSRPQKEVTAVKYLEREAKKRQAKWSAVSEV